MPYVRFDTIFRILPHVGPALGAPKDEKNANYGKSKMATSAHIVHPRKKFIKEEKFSLNDLYLEFLL